MRINTFDYFRLIAILFIVARHSYGPWVIDSYMELIIATIFTNGSALFAFIAGFFFHHVFCKNFNYLQFIIRKAKYVFSPYCFLSLLGFIYFVLIADRPPYYDQLLGHEVRSLTDHIKIGVMYLWTGRVIGPYWFIPFLMILFLISPIFLKLISLSLRNQILILLILFLISSYVHRPIDLLSPIHMVMYFLPVYVSGIIFSINRQEIIRFIKNRSLIWGTGVLVFTVAHIYLTGDHRNLYKDDYFSYGGIDVLNIQKMFMCLLLISMLYRFENNVMPVLNYLAKISVAIFFLHPWALGALGKLPIQDYLYFLPGGAIFLITVPIVVIACILIVLFIKKVVGEKSRYLIGC